MENKKKYSIRDLANGVCSLKNDGTDEELQLVLDKAFPNFKKSVSNYIDDDIIAYQKTTHVSGEWIFMFDFECENILPMQSCSVFLEEINGLVSKSSENVKLIRRFKSGAVRGDNTGRVRPDWISPYAIEEISKVLIENANDFGACNYFLGLDETACLESMSRHLEELKEAILIKKDMVEAKIIARSVGFNAVAMLHTMVLKEKGLYKEHFEKTELVTVEEAKKSNQFINQ